MSRFWLICSAFCALLLAAVPASAGPSITLDIDNGGATPFSQLPAGSNFGTITLTQFGTGTALNPFFVQVNVQLALTIPSGTHCNPSPCGTLYFAQAAGSPVLWNVTGHPALNVSLVTAGSYFTVPAADATTTGAFKAPPITGGNCGTCFMYAIAATSNGGSTSDPSSVIFNVARTGSGTASNLLINDFATAINGFYFGFDVFLSGTNGGTAVVGSTGRPHVHTAPEPLTMAVFGAGLAGALVVRRRRKLATAA